MTNNISISMDKPLVERVDDIARFLSKKTSEIVSRSQVFRIIMRNTLNDDELMEKWGLK